MRTDLLFFSFSLRGLRVGGGGSGSGGGGVMDKEEDNADGY